MKSVKRIMLLLVVLVFAFSVVACGDKEEKKETEPTKAAGDATQGAQKPTEPAEQVRDLGGKEIVIADWWSGEDYRNPNTTYLEDYWNHQDEMMEKHNYTIVRKSVSSWADMGQDAMLSITNNNPVGDIIVLDSGSVAALLDKGLFADVSVLKEFDFTDDKWNKAVLEVMTVGNAVYGFAGSTEPRTGIFFNMDLFETLGVDPELPYDLQESGEWNWANFKDLCAKLKAAGDTNSDGVQDVYPMASFSTDFFPACMVANGTDIIVNNEGTLSTNLDDPAILEALNWGYSLYEEGYVMPKPEGDDVEWNWFVQAFQEQKTCMRVCEEYEAGSIVNYDFKSGFVCFPYGPSSDGSLISIVRENILIIPSCFDDQRIADIAFAYNIFTEDTPGYEDDDSSWKGSYEAMFKDQRAVNETLDLMINKLPQVMRPTILLPDYVNDWIYNIDAGAATAAEQLEAYSSQWQQMVDDFNAKEH